MKLEPANCLAGHQTGRHYDFADRNLITRKERPAGERLAIEQNLDTHRVALRTDKDLIDPHKSEQVFSPEGGTNRSAAR